MSVHVVKELRYGSKLGYCNGVSSWATVPEISDLDSKASNADLRNLKDELNGTIEDVKSETERITNELSADFSSKLEGLKNDILSNERIEYEKRSLERIKEDIIEQITNISSTQIDNILNATEAFINIDLDKTLQPIKSSVSESINKLNEKSDKIITQLSLINDLDRRMSHYVASLNEMRSILEQVQSVCENVMNVKLDIIKIDTKLRVFYREQLDKEIKRMNDLHSKTKLWLTTCTIICLTAFLFILFF